ncbi:MAG TPA: hypothetical protein VM598_04530, partial [Bdellovibrionota bacterium]|nr:hypothetical protein [Bdellovibrionota bacterium]
NGAGTSESDAQSLMSIVASHGMSYRVADSAAIESMSLDDLGRFKVIIWPGGDSNVMTDGLSAAAREKVRQAVVSRGVPYVGFCAGAWMAVGPTPLSGSQPIWGFSILNGDYLKMYHPNGQTPVAAMVWTSFADGSSRDLVWWGGPYLPSYAGSVVARYPDGSAAILKAQAGNGFVVLSGPHPEAPQDWRTGAGLSDDDGLDFDLTWRLISAGLSRSWGGGTF